MRNQRMTWRVVMLLVIVALLAAACDGPSGTAPSAQSLLPTMQGYTSIGGQDIQGFITGLGEAGSVLTGQFGATAAIAVVDGIASCYQDVGAVAASGYTQDALPVVAGVVAIANRDLLTDPQTFLNCVGLSQQPSALSDGQGGGGMTPCAHAYTTEIGGDTFDILYAGTDIEICQAFCAGLPNCTGH